jgi:hypothetical protein
MTTSTKTDTKNPVYLICFGGLWKLTPTAYGRYLAAVAAGADVDLDSFGKQVSAQVINVTDITPENARAIIGL